MNWMRTILDGIAMAACFNLFAAAVALYRPRLMFPCYPPAIIKAAKDPPTKDLLRGVAAPPPLWCGQYCGGRDNRLLAFGPDGVYPVDDRQRL